MLPQLEGSEFGAPEVRAEDRREKAFAARHERQWRGEPLKPWSMERETLLARLIELDLPGEDLAELPGIVQRYEAAQAESARKGDSLPPLENMINIMGYLPTAAKVLYLAAHGEEEFALLRSRPGRFIVAISSWAESNITPAEVFDACLLAARIHDDWKQFKPMYRPSSFAARDDSGN